MSELYSDISADESGIPPVPTTSTGIFKRGKYAKTSEVDRQRIIAAYNENNDFLDLAFRLGIKKFTAYSIIRNYEKTGRKEAKKRGGPNNVKVNEDVKKLLLSFIELNCCVTLKEMQIKLKNQNPPIEISITTISNILNGSFYTIKKVHDMTINRNRDDIKEARSAYAAWLLNEGSAPELLKVYIDEFGCNLWLKRTFGRSLKGTPAIRKVCGQRGRNLTSIVAICHDGLLHHNSFYGSLTQDLCQDFINELTALLGNTMFVVIMDNCRSHLNMESLLEQHKIKFLPAYSPFLNPIENCFNEIKCSIKRALSSQQEISSYFLYCRQNGNFAKYCERGN